MHTRWRRQQILIKVRSALLWRIASLDVLFHLGHAGPQVRLLGHLGESSLVSSNVLAVELGHLQIQIPGTASARYTHSAI
jgi:hypothetical protein